MLPNDWIALVVTLALALFWLRLNNFAAQRGWVSTPTSRKLIHIGTGPLFVLCWLLFSDAPAARWMAAVIPLGITAQFALVGSGVLRDPAAVQAMSRSGDRREILRGPLYYGIVFVVLTLIFWRNTAIGVVALMLLCGGDGLADLVGKRAGGPRLPWSREKRWSGSLAVLLGGWLLAAGVLAAFTTAGVIRTPWIELLPGLSLISLAAALVESLPFHDVDNLTVPLVAVALGFLVF